MSFEQFAIVLDSSIKKEKREIERKNEGDMMKANPTRETP
jgi:hypothetical protein